MFARINEALDASRLKREENEKGFTLIELLVVVIIIGILAAIAIPVFLNQRESAWKASVESDLKNAALVIETYATNNNGKYLAQTTATDVTATPVSTAFPSIKISTDNVITYKGTLTNFTLSGTNKNIPKGSQEYVSDTGGLKTWVTAP